MSTMSTSSHPMLRVDNTTNTAQVISELAAVARDLLVSLTPCSCDDRDAWERQESAALGLEERARRALVKAEEHLNQSTSSSFVQDEDAFTDSTNFTDFTEWERNTVRFEEWQRANCCPKLLAQNARGGH